MQGCSDRLSSCSDFREINEAKVANILSYLDESVTAQRSSSGLSSLPLTVSNLNHNTDNSFSSFGIDSHVQAPQARGVSALPSQTLTYDDGAQTTYMGIKKRIEALNFEKEELQRENQELQHRLLVIRDKDAERAAEIQANFAKDLADLRKELATVKKKSEAQLAQLRDERDQFQRAAEATSTQLRHEMSRRDEERQKLEAANAAAIITLRSKWQTQERAARERWKLTEAKRIKETTLQSLEPDIVLLLNRHKAEQARLREDYENELRQRDEVIAAKDASVEELKSKLQRDAEAVLSREQHSFQSRLQEETERVRRQLDEERRQFKAKESQMESFFDEAKGTLQREVARLGRELLELKGHRTREEASFHEAVSKEVARIAGQSNDMLADLKEKLTLEHTHRERDAAAQNTIFLQTKEQELRKAMEIERDSAITKVIQRLEEEHVKALTSARGSDDLLRERYSQLHRDCERLRVELELTREQLQVAITARQHKEREMSALQEAADLSAKRIQSIEDRVRLQYEGQFSALDNIWQTKLHEVETQHVKGMCDTQRRMDELQRELVVERSRLEQEQRAMEQRHHAELDHINERMLVAMTRKDNTIQAQGQQIGLLEEALQMRDKQLERHRSLIEHA